LRLFIASNLGMIAQKQESLKSIVRKAAAKESDRAQLAEEAERKQRNELIWQRGSCKSRKQCAESERNQAGKS